MAYVYYAEDGSIQGFSRERSDIPLGAHCAPISHEAFEMLSAIPAGFKMDLETGVLKAIAVSDMEDWFVWIPVVLNHRYVDGEFIPILREPTSIEEWMLGSMEETDK
ncbi:MAG: hypothetical protein ACE5I9_01130 [Candidatus Methylomirabilales bacterium]